MLKYFYILFIFFSYLTAFAQSVSDTLFTTEEIKITSYQNETDILNSASNIHVLNSKSLNSLNGKNAGEILSIVPGVFVKNYGNASSLQTLSLNGLGAEHTLILLNGFKINSLQNGQFDLSLIPKESIKRIEVISNGLSSVYGSDAMGGVVNIITSDNNIINKDLSLNFGTSYGSYYYKKVFLNSKKYIGKTELGLLMSVENSDNDFDYYFENGFDIEKRKRQNSRYENQNYAFDISSRLTDKSKLYIYSQYLKSDKNVPGIETGNTSPQTKQIDKNWNTIIGFNYKGKIFSFENGINFQNNLMNYTVLPVLNNFYKNLLISNSTKINYNSPKVLSVLGLEILTGSLESDQVDGNVKRNQYSIYNSSTVTINNLLIYPSLRYDYISDIKKSVWTYKIGFNFKVFKNYNLHIRSNIGRNFRAPTFNELYWKENGNINIRPESSDNLEVGIIATGNTLINYIYDISYVYINAMDRIIWKPDRKRIWRPVNILHSESRLFNTSLRLNYQFKNNFSFNSGMSYTHNISIKKNEEYPGDVTTGKQIIYIPTEQAKMFIGFVYGNFEINFFYSYIGIRFSDSENLNPLSPSSVIDGNIKYKFTISDLELNLKFDVNNISNTDYQLVSGYPLPLRNFLFSINLNYVK